MRYVVVPCKRIERYWDIKDSKTGELVYEGIYSKYEAEYMAEQMNKKGGRKIEWRKTEEILGYDEEGKPIIGPAWKARYVRRDVIPAFESEALIYRTDRGYKWNVESGVIYSPHQRRSKGWVSTLSEAMDKCEMVMFSDFKRFLRGERYG